MKGTLLTDGVTPVALFSDNWMVPSPLPVLTVTVQLVPEPVTLLTLALLTLPVVVNEKLVVDKPLTDAANVAVNCTDVALVNVLLTALSELMVVAGAVTVLVGMATFTVVALVLVNETLPE